jgi:hypothetical protein
MAGRKKRTGPSSGWHAEEAAEERRRIFATARAMAAGAIKVAAPQPEPAGPAEPAPSAQAETPGPRPERRHQALALATELPGPKRRAAPASPLPGPRPRSQTAEGRPRRAPGSEDSGSEAAVAVPASMGGSPGASPGGEALVADPGFADLPPRPPSGRSEDRSWPSRPVEGLDPFSGGRPKLPAVPAGSTRRLTAGEAVPGLEPWRRPRREPGEPYQAPSPDVPRKDVREGVQPDVERRHRGQGPRRSGGPAWTPLPGPRSRAVGPDEVHEGASESLGRQVDRLPGQTRFRSRPAGMEPRFSVESPQLPVSSKIGFPRATGHRQPATRNWEPSSHARTERPGGPDTTGSDPRVLEELMRIRSLLEQVLRQPEPRSAPLSVPPPSYRGRM